MTYYEKLKLPKWQMRRLEIMKRDDAICRRCGNGDKTLNVHHYYYKPKCDPWDYPDDALVTVCEDCHRETEDFYRDIKLLIGVSKWRQELLLSMLKASDPKGVGFDEGLSRVVKGLRFFLRTMERFNGPIQDHEKIDAVASLEFERDQILASLNLMIEGVRP